MIRTGAQEVQEYFEPDYTTDLLDAESGLTDDELQELMGESNEEATNFEEMIRLERQAYRETPDVESSDDDEAGVA